MRDKKPRGGARIGPDKRLDTSERFSGEAAAQNASLIDFAGSARATPVALAHRLSVGTVALTRCTLHPNPGRRIGAVQLTVAVHQGAPFRMEWRMPGSDRLQQRLITPGTVHITSSNQPLWQRWRGRPRVLVIAIDHGFAFDVAQRAFDGAFSSDHLELNPAIGADDSLIHDMTALFENELTSNGASGRLFLEGLATSMAVHLARSYGAAPARLPRHHGGLAPNRLRRVTEYIADNLAADLNQSELAAVAELSQFHFARAFKESVGRSPHSYLIEQRINRAKELLADPGLSIAEVSLSVGFSSQSHLTFHFHRLTGMTPARFRRSL